MSNICDGDERVIELRTEFRVDNPELAENELAAYISLVLFSIIVFMNT